MDGTGRSPRRLAGEFLVIFIGVLAAFFAEDMRQAREDSVRARHIYSALLGEVHAYVDRAPIVVADMSARLQSWDRAVEGGERPPPAYYQEPGADSPPTAIWEATLASGGIALLDPELFNALATYYNRLGSVSERYARYNLFTEASILPLIEDGSEGFYRDNGEMRAEYRSHMRRLAEIRDELHDLDTEGRALLVGIEEALR